MCDRCHDTAHANLRLGFGATGLWDLGPLALGSLALGLVASSSCASCFSNVCG